MANVKLNKTKVHSDGYAFAVPGYPDVQIRLQVARQAKRGASSRTMLNVVSNLSISATDVVVKGTGSALGPNAAQTATEALSISKRVSGSAENAEKKKALLAIHQKLEAAASNALAEGYLLEEIVADISSELAVIYPTDLTAV